MKILSFPAQLSQYQNIDGTFVYNKDDSSIIGTLELLWSCVYGSSYDGLDRSKAKTVKNIYRRIRDITQYKDAQKNSRITKDGEQSLILEEAEYDLMKILLSHNKLSPMAAEDLDTLWGVIESAQEYTPPKPEIVK